MNNHLRRTKIVATLGPATDSSAVLSDMMRAGVDVVRVNFSHGSTADHARRLTMVREAARLAGASCTFWAARRCMVSISAR